MRHYPLHIPTAHAQTLSGNLLDDLLKQGKKEAAAVGTQALRNVVPQINKEIQKFAEEYAVSLVQTAEDFIPSAQELESIGKMLALKIEELLNEYLLPEIYNRASQQALSGVLLSDEQVAFIYNRAINKTPSIITLFKEIGSPLTLNPRAILKAALPLPKFKSILDKLTPLVTSVQARALPVVENKAKDIATFAILNGILIGAAGMFGFMKLYNSVGKS